MGGKGAIDFVKKFMPLPGDEAKPLQEWTPEKITETIKRFHENRERKKRERELNG